MTMRILLIENNKLYEAGSLTHTLEAHGYEVVLAHTAQNATKKTETLWPSLIVFNPIDTNELAHFKEAVNRTDLNIPYIVIGDKNHLPPEISTDAIIVAPNRPKQLAHSINKAVSRQKSRFIRLPALIVDCLQRRVLRNGERFALTPKEFKLLHLLIKHQGQVLSRKTIMQQVWETDYMGDTRTLDVHVRWLREKIEENASQPRHLITVRGVGYRFVATDSE